MASAGTFTDLEILAATPKRLELVPLGHRTRKLKPDSRKQIRRLEHETMMVVQLESSFSSALARTIHAAP